MGFVENYVLSNNASKQLLREYSLCSCSYDKNLHGFFSFGNFLKTSFQNNEVPFLILLTNTLFFRHTLGWATKDPVVKHNKPTKNQAYVAQFRM